MNRVLLNVSHAGATVKPHGLRLRRLAQTFLTRLELDGVELSLALVKDRQIRALNKQWRNKNAATDVLSFAAGDSVGPGLRPLGDVIISVETATRAAREFDSTLKLELARYLAHGLLHLLGYDHHTPRDARAMQRLETTLLGHAGMLSRSDEVE